MTMWGFYRFIYSTEVSVWRWHLLPLCSCWHQLRESWGKINFSVELFGGRGREPVCLKRSKSLRKVCRAVEIAQRTANFMANKISKGRKSINTRTKFPQDPWNLTPSTLLPRFPRSSVPALFSGCLGISCLGMWSKRLFFLTNETTLWRTDVGSSDDASSFSSLKSCCTISNRGPHGDAPLCKHVFSSLCVCSHAETFRIRCSHHSQWWSCFLYQGVIAPPSNLQPLTSLPSSQQQQCPLRWCCWSV